MCLQGINPQTTAAPLLLVLSSLPVLLLLLVQLSHPTFIVSDQMSASIQVATQRLRTTAASLIIFPSFFPRPLHSARLLCGSLLWSSQFFFFQKVVLKTFIINWVFHTLTGCRLKHVLSLLHQQMSLKEEEPYVTIT